MPDSKSAGEIDLQDDNLLATEDWLSQEFGHEEDLDFSVSMGDEPNTEVWENHRVRIELDNDLTDTRGNVRKIVALLRDLESA